MRTRIRFGYKYLPTISILKDLAKENDLDIIHQNWKSARSIRLLTAHGSKGLEAKVVFILNVTNDTFGFPCEIEDSNIYEPARLDYPPQDSLEEERRLFYVAMTRAIDDLYIYTWEPAISDFLNEIEEHTMEIRLSY
jgi:DNA helicase-4